MDPEASLSLAATRDSMHLMSSLCSDHLSAGFLLSDASDHWQIRCIWSGDEKNGTCAPAPNINGPVDYIAPSKWRQLIRKFREEIGCSPKEIEKVEKVQELYICKERCSHAGVGYIPSIFIMSTILFSWATFILPS
ncbi:unnamed protein product [Toxocara canis]|uniref:MH1 domain-containing protein n=1 Tax=Toxocara canis TaxID=6265 RepID=A0A183TVU8_TOXCA|nr:unnamed protein product [Toxocara canis]